MDAWKWRRCPRCGGNMFPYLDPDGYYEKCLQCSHWRELPGIAVEPDGTTAPTEKWPALGEEPAFSTHLPD